MKNIANNCAISTCFRRILRLFIQLIIALLQQQKALKTTHCAPLNLIKQRFLEALST